MVWLPCLVDNPVDLLIATTFSINNICLEVLSPKNCWWSFSLLSFVRLIRVSNWYDCVSQFQFELAEFICFREISYYLEHFFLHIFQLSSWMIRKLSIKWMKKIRLLRCMIFICFAYCAVYSNFFSHILLCIFYVFLSV